MRKEEVYLLFIKQCEEQAIDPCSRKTFFPAIRRRPRAKQVQKRQGARAAYPYEPTVYYLDQETPRHGDRPFEIGHIDHTEFDCELVCSKTGRNLGRPWATFLTDAYSRRLLATFVTFDPPSYRSCMMIVRDCVRRWGRLPERFVVDGGKEFGSVYFDMLVAVFELTKMRRPAAQPRFGSVIERLFGTTNTQFVHNLLGNTQSTRDLRTITTANDPRRQAVWTLAAFTRRLREWAYHVYDVRDHPALGQSPHDAYATGLAATGVRPSRTILYDHGFQLLTLPTTPKGHARVIPGRGVKIGCILYWCDAFRHPSVQGTAVPVRYDPFNAGLAYAYAQRVWRECRSEHLHAFRGRTERELQLASHELRRRLALVGRQQSLTSARLATFLESLEQEEEVLLQRLRAAEVRQALEEQAREAGFIAAGDNRPTDGLGQVVDADTPPAGPQDQLSSSRYEDASPDAESVSASRRRLADSAILPTYEQY